MRDGLPPRIDTSHLPDDLRAIAKGLQRSDDFKYYLIHSALMLAAREIERIAFERDQLAIQSDERISRLETLLKQLERWFKTNAPSDSGPTEQRSWQHRLRDIHQALATT